MNLVIRRQNPAGKQKSRKWSRLCLYQNERQLRHARVKGVAT
jgi:hypothetical protein